MSDDSREIPLYDYDEDTEYCEGCGETLEDCECDDNEESYL